MKPKDRRALYKEQMADRQRENFANKDNSGRFGDIYNAEKKLDVKFWKCSEDDHEIYMVPYIVGAHHPRLAKGKVDFVLDVHVHRKVGINEDNVICLNRTFKKKCPICEYQAELKESPKPDKELIKSLNPTRRNIFNIVCLDNEKEKDKGVQVWDVSQWLFTLPLEDLAHKKKGGGEVLYAHIDQGKVISFKKKGKTQNTTEYTAFEFKEREEIPDEILEQVVCLDELVHIPTYEEVQELFFQSKDDGEITHASEEEDHTENAEEDDTPPEKPAEEKKPEKKTLAKKEDVQEPKEPECPYGAVFGTDFDEYEECNNCDIKEACQEKKEELTKPPEPPKKKVLSRKA